VNVIAGLDSIDQDKLDLMNSFDASRWETFKLVKVPHGLPYVFAGLDVAIVLSVLGAIVGEFVGSQRGLGNLLLVLSFAMDIPGVFSVLIVLSVLGVGLHLIVVVVWKRVVFWMEPHA
jgi:NitT/TauT family transport system permease protein